MELFGKVWSSGEKSSGTHIFPFVVACFLPGMQMMLKWEPQAWDHKKVDADRVPDGLLEPRMSTALPMSRLLIM